MTVEIDLAGKRGVVFGVANQRSIAYAIAEKLSAAGAGLAFTYLNDRLKPGVEKAIQGLPGSDQLLYECDATDDCDVEAVYDQVAGRWDGQLDFVVHSIAYAERDDLGGDFSTTGRQGFRTALETSAYTLMPIVSRAAPYMQQGGSVVTMTFDASVRVYPGYNIMGTAKAALENIVRQLAAQYGKQDIRVNAISAGPLPTLAARSIPGFREMTRAHRERSPLKRNITHEEVGNTALFLLSPMSSGITGATIPVDAGYGILAM